MYRWDDLLRRGLAALIAGVSITSVIAAPTYGFGQPATPLEIAGWDIDVRPDGTGLPLGRGSVAAGQRIYDGKCASCHGTFGESNSYLQIAGGVGSLASDQPVRTTGSKLNYATTLWDYINRAMPFEAPKTLTPDEVYALTAYVLYLNDILPADAVLDRDSLPRLTMPNQNGFTTAHGFMIRDGKPDTRNVACMKSCAAQVRLTSEMPAHTHAVGAQTNRLGDVAAPAGTTLGHPASGNLYVTGGNPSLVAMSPQALSVAGGNQPHNNMQPYLTLNFCIALQGIFPPRP